MLLCLVLVWYRPLHIAIDTLDRINLALQRAVAAKEIGKALFVQEIEVRGAFSLLLVIGGLSATDLAGPMHIHVEGTADLELLLLLLLLLLDL